MVNQSLLSATDFDGILDNYFGRNVSLIPRTRVLNNISGGETLTNGTPGNIKCFFLKHNQPWVFDKVAQIQGGDAILLSKYADGVKKDDVISADGEKFVVKDIINVPGVFNSAGNPTFIYSACNLFLYQDA